ncbi:MAG: mechanosensitive ion channel family protein [Francisellaceae bacterium]
MSLLLVFVTGAVAAEQEPFSVERANAQFDQISLKLSTQNLEAAALENAVRKLKALNQDAKNCLASSKSEVENIDAKLKELGLSAEPKPNEDLKYLSDKKQRLSKRMAQCRLFSIRSDEAIRAYVKILHELARSELLKKTTPIWSRFVNYNTTLEAFSSFSIQSFIKPIIEKWYWFVLLIIGYIIYGWLLKWYLRHPQKIHFAQMNNLEQFKSKFLTRMRVVGFISFIAAILYMLFYFSSEPKMVSEFIYELMISTECIVLFWTLLLIRYFITYRPVYWMFVALFGIVLLGTMILALIGYHNLATYSVVNIFLSIFMAIIVLVIVKLINKLITALNGRKHIWQNKLHYYLGIKPHKKITELAILKIVSGALGVMFYIGLMVQAWGWKTIYPEKFVIGITEGFTIFNITIEPIQIIIAILVFVGLSFMGRFISAYVARKHQQNEKDLQVALASIVGYLAFAFALIIALLVSGVNFTGLAIIAGALSVGIGLGLQDIVNNFVSGIILLIEKPIRPGDRIIVGETEGIVKKVRVRATQIATMSKSDVIVPNADLIKNQVTNYMFRDQYWRIACKVGVAYGSDIELVKKVLLDIASKHGNVVQEGADAPVVIFKEFGDSSLNFELWCIIKNVNNKFVIQSELNFEIDHAFKAHDIVIAFPQRDVHLYNHDVTLNKDK